jgi:hypothetical protein
MSSQTSTFKEGDRVERRAAGDPDTRQKRKRLRKERIAEKSNRQVAAVARSDASAVATVAADDGQRFRQSNRIETSLKAGAGARTRMSDLDHETNHSHDPNLAEHHQVDKVHQPPPPRTDPGGICSPVTRRDPQRSFRNYASGHEVAMDEGTDSDSFRDSSEQEPSNDPKTAQHSTTPFALDAARPSGPRSSKWRVLSSQKKVLLDAFAAQPYPSPSEKEALADTVGVTVTQLAKWFQHRREALGRTGKFQVLFNRARRSAAESTVLQSELFT